MHPQAQFLATPLTSGIVIELSSRRFNRLKIEKIDFNFSHFSSRRNDWAHREGMLLLREREAAGIFPIDKNFVDPAKLELPTDEELGDTPIFC